MIVLIVLKVFTFITKCIFRFLVYLMFAWLLLVALAITFIGGAYVLNQLLMHIVQDWRNYRDRTR